MDENDVWNNEFNSELLDFLPEKSYVVASLSLNPMEYFNIFEQENSFEKIQSEFEKETELDLKELFEGIKGNVAYSLFGFENIEYTYMGWGYGINENVVV
jgi:hypothetical protein